MTVRPMKSIYVLGTEGWTVAGNIIEELYANASVALDRKAVKAKEIIELVACAAQKGSSAGPRLKPRLLKSRGFTRAEHRSSK